MPEKNAVASTPSLSKEQARQELDVERDAILADTADDQTERWRTGFHYANIVERNLATLAGYKTAAEFINAELKPKDKSVSQTALTLYARVARAFDEATTSRYGTTVLDKLLTLRDLLDIDALPRDLATLDVRTADETGAPVTKAFSECTVANLSAAIRLQKKPDAKVDPKAADEAAKMDAAVDAKLGEDGPFKVVVHRRGSNLFYDLKNIPTDRLDDVLDALKARRG
ncbi:MAG: hypothetical protein QM765_13810 [Myxococcales bacterium]